MEYKQRKHPRLKTFDYAAGGVFCVTICTAKKQKILGAVVAGEKAYVELSPVGALVWELIACIPCKYSGVTVLNYVVMPNHIHMLLQISPSNPVSLFTVIRSLKTIATKRWGHPIWQRSYFEHIVRGEQDALRYWKYIDENPMKWLLDPYYE